jgi:hypothetical protein
MDMGAVARPRDPPREVMMPALIRSRRVASTALSSAALVLLGSGKITKWAADAVRPGQVTAKEVGDVYALRGQVKPPPQEPVAAPGEPEASGHARTSMTHAAELADRPAAEVIAAVNDLSTDELRLLLEHEESHKRRKSVIDAIERAADQHVR